MRDKRYRDQTRAFGFVLSPIVGAFDKPLGEAGKPFQLVAPYDKTQAAWATTRFTNIYNDTEYAISVEAFDETT